MNPQVDAQAVSQECTELDIAIVGGAMAGATLALGLASLARKLSRPLKIAVIEAFDPARQHPGFDARSIAIANGSVFELKRLGIWPLLEDLGTAITDIHVSDRGHFGMTELNAGQFALDSLGQVVELERVGQRLFGAIAKRDIQLYCPARLEKLQTSAAGHSLTLSNGQRLSCRLLLAADGVNSSVRAQQQQALQQFEFGQSAVIANVATDKSHNGMAWERFTEHGPLALLPMGDSDGQARLSLVWALSHEEAERVQALPQAEFLQQLQQAFGYRAGRFVAVGERHRYPLSLSYMPRPIYHRTLYLGNAAQTLHPIAGQGFNLGLRDLVTVLETLEPVLAAGGDPGAAQVLHTYHAAREQDRRQTINNIEFLVRGFSNNYWPLVAGRNLGLRILSWCPPLKTPVAHRAMGWHRQSAACLFSRSQ
ncbi:2-octaprenyl-6-methoxyphenyl hydroxylase [Shewanella algae]|uniref:2-octaprenyl-6-methoxyphenyl hydroxylase n=1 Tax=Shewanella algae TaxID=38313 RepID=UPI0013202EDD|nr:2-octaprenyl-6-methoxyphenyl hydroxylase [Shewanella algae]QHD53978.1 2-octaprenyl-6-methoxyphenyl hydroxylase [Shewanella algae]